MSHSVAKFEEGELGTPIDLDKVPAHIQSVLSLTETQRSHGAAEKRYTPENPAGAMPADRPKRSVITPLKDNLVLWEGKSIN